MAAYTVIDELRSIEFHDSCLENAYLADGELHFIFSAAIIIGHSRMDIQGRIPCSLNNGEDRYACPQLSVTIKDFRIRSVLRGGCWSRDAAGNTIEEYPPRNLSPEEYSGFLKMVHAEKCNHVYGLHYDSETGAYTLSFFMNADANYYELEFTAGSSIAEFEAFGEEAWYLDSKWRKHTKNE